MKAHQSVKAPHAEYQLHSQQYLSPEGFRTEVLRGQSILEKLEGSQEKGLEGCQEERVPTMTHNRQSLG